MPETATKTDPSLWERAKEEAKSRMGGKHSARAMQLAVQIYKKKGGGYSGAKPSASSNSLKKWTKQKWQWTGRDKPGPGGTGVYLPEAKAERLKSTEEGRRKLRTASEKKREATRAGEQYSSHGLAAGTSLKKASMLLHPALVKAAAAAPKKLKVIYIDETGAGHRSQANNIVDAAKRMGVDAEAVDFSKSFMQPQTHQERSGALRKTFVNYLNAKGSVPSSLKLGLEVGRFHAAVDKDRVNRFIAQNRNAQIAFAHPHVEHHFTHVDRPMSVIHTDPAPWPLYFQGKAKGERVHIGAGTSTKGIENSVAVSGIPVAPKLLQKRFKKSGLLHPGKFNITVSGGGEAVEVPEMVEHVLKSKLPKNVQIHAVAGRRADVLEKLKQIAARDPRVKAHGFAPLPSMMREAKLNVIRSHGTSFAETLAAGKPAVYYGPKKSLDLQGGLTRHTAIHAGERTGHPVAIGLHQLPHAINQARSNYRAHAANAVKLRESYGDPASEIARAAMSVGMPKKEKS